MAATIAGGIAMTASCVIDPDATASLGFALDDDGQPVVVIERCRGHQVSSVHVVDDDVTSLYLDDLLEMPGWHIEAPDPQDVDAVTIGDVPPGFEVTRADLDVAGLPALSDTIAVVFLDGAESPHAIRLSVLFPTIGGRIVDPRGFTSTPAEFAQQCA